MFVKDNQQVTPLLLLSSFLQYHNTMVLKPGNHSIDLENA